jgi:hypothetical protein
MTIFTSARVIVRVIAKLGDREIHLNGHAPFGSRGDSASAWLTVNAKGQRFARRRRPMAGKECFEGEEMLVAVIVHENKISFPERATRLRTTVGGHRPKELNFRESAKATCKRWRLDAMPTWRCRIKIWGATTSVWVTG